ncbi:MAG TPA: RNA polymerase sigma factor [Pyrinomonadaceae bacterium]|nr:RNA polymerase sigma factor [Pyrinomonadaceae bacterium]
MELAELKPELERLHVASFGWALSCCQRDRAEAEDVLQSVYLKILQGKARYRGEASFKTWLFAVIRKTALNERRSRTRRMLRALIGLDRERNCNANHSEPNAEFERSERQGRFLRALALLSPRQREVLHLVFYEDLSLKESATVMGVSIGSARQHYERGKKRLRISFEATEVDYGVSWERKQNPGAVS